MRVRAGGSHHQKFVVLRHPGRPELDVAFVGGIDLCHSRRDDAEHHGDPQPQPMAKVYGPRPPWHDVMVALRGPAVGDVETVFRERWEDPQPLTRNPVDWRRPSASAARTGSADPLPPQLPDPAPVGTHARAAAADVPEAASAAIRSRRTASAASRTATPRRCGGRGAWSTSRTSTCGRPRSPATFAEALRAQPGLHVVAVAAAPPRPGRPVLLPPNLVGRDRALLDDAGRRRRPGRGLRHREPRRHARLRPRQGLHRRRHLGHGRLGQLQPPVLDARLGADRRGARRRPATRGSRATPAGSATGPGRTPASCGCN